MAAHGSGFYRLGPCDGVHASLLWLSAFSRFPVSCTRGVRWAAWDNLGHPHSCLVQGMIGIMCRVWDIALTPSGTIVQNLRG